MKASSTEVVGLMGGVAAASREQSQGIEQINKAVAQMDEGTQQNAALVEEAAAAAQSMQNQAGNLAMAVSVFKLNSGGGQMVTRTKPGARPSNKSASTSKAVSKPKSTPAAAPSNNGSAHVDKQLVVTKAGGSSDDWEEF